MGSGVYRLAILGAALVCAGEVCGIEARRGRWVDVVGSVAFLGAYWVWREMRPWEGVSRPAGVWTAIAAVAWIVLSAIYRETEDAWGRALFVLGISALALREVRR